MVENSRLNSEVNKANFYIPFSNKHVVSVELDGTVTLNTGGWRTPKAKKVMNEYLKNMKHTWKICVIKNKWFLCGIGKKYEYKDGLVITPKNIVLSVQECTDEENVDIKREINMYVAQYITLWADGRIPVPTTADPWNLYSKAQSYNSIEEFDEEFKYYMLSYMKNKYFFGSILMSAINYVGGSCTGKLSIVDKINVEKWLNRGKYSECKLAQGTAKKLKPILIKFLLHVFTTANNVSLKEGEV
jgi:hypothetical protein